MRGLERLVLNERLRFLDSLALTEAVSNSAIRRDGNNGNPGLDKIRSKSQD